MKKTSRTRKTSIRVWNPLFEKFTQLLGEACLRRDAWLTKVLEREIDEIEAAGSERMVSFRTVPERVNSEAARQFIATRLDALPCTLVTFTFPEALVHRINALCKRKRIVRDSFFNRLIFLLVAHEEHITHLFFNDDPNWKTLLMEQTDLLSDAAEHFAKRIPEFRDPLESIRAALGIEEWQNSDAPEQGYKNEWYGSHRIYTDPITADTFPGFDLSGLNVYLSDDHLPAVTSHASVISLDDLLPPMSSTTTGSESRHAKQQKQRRGMCGDNVNLLLLYGSKTHDHRGAELYHFDKAARRRLERDWSAADAQLLDRLHRTYAVCGTDGTVVTAGHRYTRIRRDQSRRDRWPSGRAHRKAGR